MAAWRKVPTNASNTATTQTPHSRRTTGTPSIEARSERSAMARTATPTSVRRRATATTAMHTSEATTANTSSPPNTVWPRAKRRPPGTPNAVWDPLVSWMRFQSRGTRRAATAKNWARPMVATVSTRRAERRNRRTTTASIPAPVSTATTSPTATPPT